MKKYIFLAFLAALCLFVSCGTKQTVQEASEEPEARVMQASPSWGAQDFNKIYTGADLGDFVSPGLKLNVEIQVPFIENAKDNKSWRLMNESFELLGQSFLDQSIEWLGVEGLDPQIPYTVDVGFARMRDDEEFVSIRYDCYRYFGGAYPVTSLRGATYNAQTGNPVYLGDLFSVTEDFYVPVLIEEIEKIAEIPLSRQDLESYFDFNNFYLKKDALVIFYQEEQLGPHAIGTPEFAIPFKSLAPIFLL